MEKKDIRTVLSVVLAVIFTVRLNPTYLRNFKKFDEWFTAKTSEMDFTSKDRQQQKTTTNAQQQQQQQQQKTTGTLIDELRFDDDTYLARYREVLHSKKKKNFERLCCENE